MEEEKKDDSGTENVGVDENVAADNDQNANSQNRITIDAVEISNSEIDSTNGDMFLDINKTDNEPPLEQQLPPDNTKVVSPIPALDQTARTMGAFPAEIKRWNWGAFLLTWIWGIGNHVWISLIALIPAANLAMAIVLGIRGNEWAWQSGKFKSLEEFKKAQTVWTRWGIIILVLSFLLCSLLYGLFIYLAISNSDTGSIYDTIQNNNIGNQLYKNTRGI